MDTVGHGKPVFIPAGHLFSAHAKIPEKVTLLTS